MDLEGFYAADERRRASVEIELGRDWHDARGVRYELSWVQDTGEVYAMREPAAAGSWSTPFGDWVAASLPEKALTVRVLGHVASRAQLDQLFNGWPAAMAGPDSIRWALSALRQWGDPPPGGWPASEVAT